MRYILALLFVLLSFAAKAQLSNESELGIATVNGNTKTKTYNARQLNDYKWNSNIMSFKSRYLNAKANGKETARYFLGGLRYERQFANHFGVFIGEAIEKDKFAGIDKRLITDTGAKYRFIDTEKTKLFSELGYRYMHEQRTDETFAFSHYGRVYSEWDHKWNANFSNKYWAEYLPNITENKDWQLNTEFSLLAVLNSIFSMKSAVLLRHDNAPAPGIFYKTDTLFTTALVAKF